jgi:Reverse transcriptase (RNA-dependent DNA polymerase).
MDSIHSKRHKKEKAAGPDIIYNEYLKDTAQLLVHTWTKLYNKCLELATIPEQWRQSIIKVLYKGKGDLKDTNKYRGKALENNPFKVFTKLITERIRLTLEEHLPESQFGFRRGRSTLLWNYC